ENVIAQRGIHLKGRGVERAGPCPVCGGDDRFSINTAKNVWNCRGCDKGGDVIDLLRHIDGVDFKDACENLTGESAPKSAAEQVPTAKFKYLDEHGHTLFVVTRCEYRNPDGSFVLNASGKHKKTFRQSRPDPERPNGWLHDVNGVPNVP